MSDDYGKLIYDRLGRIADVICARPLPDVSDAMKRLHAVVDIFDGCTPRERRTLMALLSERFNQAGERRE